MKIIFAQGNPGSQYNGTRHNVGFWVVDFLAEKWDVSFQEKSKFNAFIAETVIDSEKVLLVKPLSYYNDTGLVARKLIDFYKIDPSIELLVIHDELALPLGVIRSRLNGSDAGNNGIKSLNSHVGPDYARLRIGVYTEMRDQMNDADFVLGKFSKDEQATLEVLTPHILTFVNGYLHDSLEITKVTVSYQIDKKI